MSGIAHPSINVVYSSSGAFAGEEVDVSSDVLECSPELRELKLGVSSFYLRLNNKSGKYDSTLLPAAPDEAGLHYYWRIKINGRTIGVFTSEDMDTSFAGDELIVTGYSMFQEGADKKVPPQLHAFDEADDIIADLITDCSLSTLGYSSGTAASKIAYQIPAEGQMNLRDCLQEIAERIEWDAFDDCRAVALAGTKATLLFHSKSAVAYKLNTVFTFNLSDATNNVLSGRQPRSTKDVYNYLYLPGHPTLYQKIPSDRDVWSEVIKWTDYLGTERTMWAKTAGTSLIATDADGLPLAGVGAYYIRCVGSYISKPNFYLDVDQSSLLANAPIGSSNWNATYLEFYLRSDSLLEDFRVTLEDSNGDKIYKDYDESGHSYTWTSYSVAVNTWTAWKDEDGGAAEAGDLDWDTIAKIHFEDRTTYVGVVYGTRLDVDTVHFTMGAGSATYRSDATSISSYGQRDLELKLPVSWLWTDLYSWVGERLDIFKQPIRVVTLTAIIDPATVYEDDGTTAAPLFPTYLVQLDSDRWTIDKAGVNDGVWWRLLRVKWNWSPSDFNVEVDVAPTAQEGSSENYSYISGDRYRIAQNPEIGIMSRLQGRIKLLEQQVVGLGKGYSPFYYLPGAPPTGAYFVLNDDNLATGTNTFQGLTHFMEVDSAYDLILSIDSTTDFTADRTLTVDLENADRTLTIQGNLTVESASLVNQDLTTDASPTFADITTNNLLCSAADSYNIGGVNNEYRNLYLGDGGGLYFGLSQDIRLFRGAANTLSISVATVIRPSSDNAIDLGDTTHEWKDVFVDGSIYTDNLYIADAGTTYNLSIVSDSTANFSANRILTIDLANAARSLVLQGNLTVESASLVNQDLTTDANVTFANVTMNNALPAAADTWSLGSVSAEWRNLYLGDAGAIVFGLTQDGGRIFRGAANTLSISVATVVRPSSDNAIDLGATSYEWKDLYVTGSAYIDALGEDIDFAHNYPLEADFNHWVQFSMSAGATDITIHPIPSGACSQDRHFHRLIFSVDVAPGAGKSASCTVTNGVTSLIATISDAATSDVSTTDEFDWDVSAQALTFKYSQDAGGSATRGFAVIQYHYKVNA